MTISQRAGVNLRRGRMKPRNQRQGFVLDASAGRAREPDLLPMINIIFLLLVVFMLLGRIERTAPVVVAPPASEAVLRGHSQAELLIPAKGDVVFDGQLLGMDMLESRLVNYQPVVLPIDPASDSSQQISDNGDIISTGILRIRADRDVTMQRLAELFEIIRSAGIEQVEIETVAGAAMP